MSIDEFIDIVAPKLKMSVVKGYDNIKGSELKLTGYKEVKGKPIEDHVMYKIPTPIIVPVDHRWKLKLAWLRGGKPAVKTYLSKFLTAAVLKEVIKVL